MTTRKRSNKTTETLDDINKRLGLPSEAEWHGRIIPILRAEGLRDYWADQLEVRIAERFLIDGEIERLREKAEHWAAEVAKLGATVPGWADDPCA